MTQTAFITGGTGGLGLALTQLLATSGWHVFAGDCDQAALTTLATQDNITPVFIDVSNTESVTAAFQTVKSQTNTLDAVVNFAGIIRVGGMIEMQEDILRQVLDINLMGTFRVNKAFFPLIKQGQHCGRIINISSETGWHTASPFNGPYAMSKYGIEAYSDTLRRELNIYNVPVICIQPGPFKTNLVSNVVNNFNQASHESSLYKKQLEKFGRMTFEANQKAGQPDNLAKVIHKALTVKKPKHRYSVEADKGRSILEWLPMSWADAIFKKIMSA